MRSHGQNSRDEGNYSLQLISQQWKWLNTKKGAVKQLTDKDVEILVSRPHSATDQLYVTE